MTIVPLEIHTLQSLYEMKGQLDKVPHRHRNIKIVWLRRGNGSLHIHLKEYVMKPDTMYSIVPGQLHQLEFDEMAEGYLISLHENILNSGDDDFELIYRSAIIDLLTGTPGVRIGQEAAAELEEILRKLQKELDSHQMLCKEIIIKYAGIFLIQLARQFTGALQFSLQSASVCLVKNFIMLVEKKYMSWKMVQDYAEELSVSPTYLTTIVLKVSGFTASHHIRRRLVLEAKRQAAFSSMNMKEISNNLGFKDSAHFSKFFKVVSGKNFTTFRKELCGQFRPMQKRTNTILFPVTHGFSEEPYIDVAEL